MLTVGVTGPTGAGKTTVLDALEGLGCACVDCDALYHDLLKTSPQLREELTDRFGRGILSSQGQVDRPVLANVVFDDAKALLDLNAIAHRHVLDACRKLAEEAKAQGKPGLVFDAIALIESGLGALCDVTVAVTAPEDVRLRRIMARDGIGEDYARKRIAAQKPQEYYVNHCDYAICNDGSKPPEELAQEVRRLFASKLCKL